MTPSPLAFPEPWQLVAHGYAAEAQFVMRPFSLRAMELVTLGSRARVIDVAAGPGTLSLELAPRVGRIDAVDFSEQMVLALKSAAQGRGLENVFPVVADGQALPFEAALFDAGFSMFGLMFFPDRARGYAELLRVLRPGGKVIVSSWAPIADSPLINLMFGAVRVIDSGWPAPQRDPLGLENPDVLAGELRAAGFEDVEIVPHKLMLARSESPDPGELWERMARSSAPLALLRRRLGEAAWAERIPHALAFLERELPITPELSTSAWLGVGTKPS